MNKEYNGILTGLGLNNTLHHFSGQALWDEHGSTVTDAAMKVLNWIGERTEDIDQAISVRNILEQNIIGRSLKQHLPEEVLDYSYHDLRKHTAGGAGNIAWGATKVLGGTDEQANTASDATEFVADIALPQGVDLAFGAGKLTKAAKTAATIGSDVLRAGQKLVQKASDVLDPKLAIAGADGLVTKLDDVAYLGKENPLLIEKSTNLGADLAQSTPLAARVSQKLEIGAKSDLVPEMVIGAKNKISTKPMSKIFKDNPELQASAEQFMRDAYIYKRNNPDGKLEGFGRFVDNKGNLWLAKTNNKRTDPLSLKLVPQSKKQNYSKLRASRESPWITRIPEIKAILEKRGEGHRLNELITLMRREYLDKVAAIKAEGLTKGHIQSLANKGLDIAENIKGEIGKSTNSKLGNYARTSRHDDAKEIAELNIPTTLEDYINLKFGRVKQGASPNFSEAIQKNIRRNAELGRDETRWRSANTQFTWSKADNRGYIDIIKDTVADKDVPSLKKQFFSQIDGLPSGTTWTLEADTAQKYRIYKRMFKNDPRITPGGDATLLEKRGIDHFVLTIP